MNVCRLSKLDAARAELEEAIDAYASGKDLICIVLASACEEIFGKHCELNGQQHAQNELMSLALDLGLDLDEKSIKKLLNKTKNALKHFNDPSETHIEIDELDSIVMIIRACINCLRVGAADSALLSKLVAARKIREVRC